MKPLRIFTLCIICLHFLSQVKPAFGEDFLSPRTMALGGSGHASPLFTDAIYLNPSFISLMPIEALSLSATHSNFGNILNFSSQIGSRDLPFQGGIGLTLREGTPIIHLGLSKAISDRISFGIGSKFIGKLDGSLSLTAIFTDWIRASLILDNVGETAKDLGFYRELTLGTKINFFSLFQIYFDPSWAPSFPNSNDRLGLQAGIESSLWGDLFIRAGRFQNASMTFHQLRADGWSGGLGWHLLRISVDYAILAARIPLGNSGITWVNTAGLSVFF